MHMIASEMGQWTSSRKAAYTMESPKKERDTLAHTLVLDGGENDGVVVFDLLHVYGDLGDGLADVIDLGGRKHTNCH